jgi:hypothetical protein
MVVVMHTLGEPEVLGVERSRPFSIADSEGNVVEGHQAILAADGSPQ